MTSSWSSSLSSFQQERLGEQLRLEEKRKRDDGSGDDGASPDEDESSSEETSEAAASDTSDDNAIASLSSASASEGAASEEASDVRDVESDAALFPEGLPDAPMMTYQKYLTMLEKRVKVTVRYSADAGLRPFYLTVANEIKSAHPDVLLEKRILPPASGGGGGMGEEAIFEVVVDGKTVIGKKKMKMLKVSSRNDNNGAGGEVSSDSEGGGSKSKRPRGGIGVSNTPDIAGGRSVFVSMEKLDHELSKARKRRRPNTLYKSKEDALRGAMERDAKTVYLAGSRKENVGDHIAAQSMGMTEAVMRLERLKAMSTRNKGFDSDS